MSVFFRYRKYDSVMDSSYSITNGPECFDNRWRIGEQVSVMFDVTEEQEAAINDARKESEFTSYHKVAQINCRVVEVTHAISWKQVGQFRDIGTQFILEAESGMGEDVLEWIIFGKQPSWVESESHP